MSHYLNLSKEFSHRLFSLIDQHSISPTYGCFDRNYWKYKTQDYFNARMQEAAYSLGLLYSFNHADNPYYKDEKTKALSIAGMKFWAKNQNPSGGFNEYIPNENSQVGTCFSAFAIAKNYLLLGIQDQEIVNALEKAAEFLHREKDFIVVNHEAGSVAVFYLVYLITKNEKYLNYSNERLLEVLQHQNNEGWFYEYGGADPSYQSFSIYYLADYFSLSKNEKCQNMLKKAVNFFANFIHPDYSVGGQYASREATIILPTGFEKLKGIFPISISISHALLKGYEGHTLTSPVAFDDRFICTELYPFLESAFLEGGEGKGELLPIEKPEFSAYYGDTGLFLKKTQDYFVVANVKKGGVLKVYKGNELVLNDYGWVLEAGNQSYLSMGPSSVTMEGHGPGDRKKDELEFIISGSFYHLPEVLPSTVQSIGMRALNAIGMYSTIKGMLREKLVLEKKKSEFSYKRKLRIGKEIKIIDEFDSKIKYPRTQLTYNTGYSPLYTISIGLSTGIKNKHPGFKWNENTVEIQF